jgi:LOB domain-containing protein 18
MVLSASADGTVGGPSGSGGIGGWGGGCGNGNRNGAGGGRGGGGGPCGACKFLRRKCVNGCIFAPLFDSEQGVTNFAVVHKVFGASNTAKMLEKIPPYMRPDAVFSLFYEAQARVCDPVYGCASEILTLREQV